MLLLLQLTMMVPRRRWMRNLFIFSRAGVSGPNSCITDFVFLWFLCLSVCAALFACVYVSLCLFVCRRVRHRMCLSVSLFVCVIDCVCLAVYVCMCQSVCLCV